MHMELRHSTLIRQKRLGMTTCTDGPMIGMQLTTLTIHRKGI